MTTGTLFPNIAKARRDHPLSSHESADVMNKGDKLMRMQLNALVILNMHNGHTAKGIGMREAQRRFSGTVVTNWEISRIVFLSGVVQKRMSELVALELAEIKVINGKRLCYITEKGREKLKLETQ